MYRIHLNSFLCLFHFQRSSFTSYSKDRKRRKISGQLTAQGKQLHGDFSKHDVYTYAFVRNVKTGCREGKMKPDMKRNLHKYTLRAFSAIMMARGGRGRDLGVQITDFGLI